MVLARLANGGKAGTATSQYPLLLVLSYPDFAVSNPINVIQMLDSLQRDRKQVAEDYHGLKAFTAGVDTRPKSATLRRTTRNQVYIQDIETLSRSKHGTARPETSHAAPRDGDQPA
jgi:hypothetical protein